MAGEKMTLKGLYTKLDALKYKYEEEIIQLKETINQQEVRINILENTHGFRYFIGVEACHRTLGHQTMANMFHVEVFDYRFVDHVRSTDNHLVHISTCQDGESSLVQVHEWLVGASVSVDFFVGV